eukprot:s2402_g5.t1
MPNTSSRSLQKADRSDSRSQWRFSDLYHAMSHWDELIFPCAGPSRRGRPLQRPKAIGGVSTPEVPLRMRQIICGVLFKDFVAESRQEGFQLRGNQREKAVNFSQRGEINSLVRLFRRLELKRAAGTGEGAPQFRVILKPGGQQAIVGLFLDDELSWERARENLRHEEVLSHPRGGEA